MGIALSTYIGESISARISSAIGGSGRYAHFQGVYGTSFSILRQGVPAILAAHCGCPSEITILHVAIWGRDKPRTIQKRPLIPIRRIRSTFYPSIIRLPSVPIGSSSHHLASPGIKIALSGCKYERLNGEGISTAVWAIMMI